MEKVKAGSLRREFFAAVTVTLAAVAALSALTVWGCVRLRGYLVPETDYVMLRVDLHLRDGSVERTSQRYEIDGAAQEFNPLLRGGAGGRSFGESAESAEIAVESLDYGIGKNGPRRRAAYIALGAAMGVLPAAYALAGTLLAALWFYRRRLAPGLAALDGAARHIREQDLDFTVESDLQNELGELCGSFEQMRQALYDSNVKLWRTLEERRTVSRCVAHDLRNPLAIMKGTVEHTRELAAAGALTGERLESALESLDATARRMERYTDYIRDLDALGDTELRMSEVSAPGFFEEAAGTVRVLAGGEPILVEASFEMPECRLMLDREIFYRVLENVFSNAVRYAASRILLTFTLRGETLCVRVSDDGPGFPDSVLEGKTGLYRSGEESGGHLGLGLAASRVLAELHGGALRLGSAPGGGASVELTLAVKITQQ